MFTYSPLRRENSEIRLVRFVEPPDGSTKLHLELCHASMNDTAFNALSYLWGDWTQTIDIVLNGQPFPIGSNLHDGLKQLRENGFRSWIWIDSICIHQSDLDEKSWQVQEMRTVYSQAECVYMWLGRGTDDTDKAMDFISLIGFQLVFLGAIEALHSEEDSNSIKAYFTSRWSGEEYGSDQDPKVIGLARFMYDLMFHPALEVKRTIEGRVIDNESPLYGLEDLANRGNWRRIWIIQEVTLARTGVVLCGTRSMALDSFHMTLMALQRCLRYDPRPTIFFNAHRIAGFHTTWGSLLPLVARSSHRHYKNASTTLASILYRNWIPGPNYEASDPRDLVFGLLGIIDDADQLGLCADYTLSMAHVFTTVTKAFLASADEAALFNGYQLRSCISYNSGVDGLPSWVPDWRKVGKNGMVFCDTREWAAAAAGMPHIQGQDTLQSHPSLWVLRCHGCFVDVVTDVMEMPRQEYGVDLTEMHSQVLASVLQFTGLGAESGPAEDYVWRTIVEKTHRREFYSTGTYHTWMDGDVGLLVRRLMRLQHVECDDLTPDQLQWINSGPPDSRDLQTLQEQLTVLKEMWSPRTLSLLESNPLFKTAKDMLGSSRTVHIQRGDVVTILRGSQVPMVLRPRDQGGYTLIADTYIDGIMGGEFLETAPTYQVFDIH